MLETKWTLQKSHMISRVAHPRGALIHIMECTPTEWRYRVKEGPKTIIGAETSTASTVTSSICPTQLSTPILSKSTQGAQTAKLSPCPPQAGAGEGLRRLTAERPLSALTRGQKTFFHQTRERVVQSTPWAILQRCTNRSFIYRKVNLGQNSRKCSSLTKRWLEPLWSNMSCTSTWSSSLPHSTKGLMLGPTFIRITT